MEDKIIYLISFTWNSVFITIFVFGTLFNLYNVVSDDSWMIYWKYQVIVNIVYAFIIIIWFTIGGLIDVKKMLSSLKFNVRDYEDSGWVETVKK